MQNSITLFKAMNKEKFIIAFIFTLLISHNSFAHFDAPVIRAKVGMFSTKVSAGELVSNEDLGSLITIQPSVLWDFPLMRSRLGFHYIGDFGSKFGMTPISGIGLSGYYYITGLSSAHETDSDGALIQKSKPGFFTFGSVTPVNFNLNKKDEPVPNDNFTFSSVILEIMLGVGYEYPIKPNSLFSVELAFRDGNTKYGGQDLNYSSLGLFFSFTTSYY